MPDINLFSVIVAAVAGMILGGSWYSVFGNTWMKLTGMTKKQVQKAHQEGMGTNYVLCFIGLLIMSYVLGLLIYYTDSTTWLGGAFLGFLLWLGFLATTQSNAVIWEGKPIELYVLNTLHYLVVLVAIGAILGGWA